ncbi:MAG: phosphatidylserine decarboxylase [SAR86 cluster bacterium]|uniref:Phosphatidylserine decarboxylase proenzyme n=1 Tax=SAR86 cluster bacterium TaxID=2030880 RepID=A0A2A5B8A5_9GAMM|nr:MAG: phosphatidylserine decarboxylase [SAR86 cluster bacterium]
MSRLFVALQYLIPQHFLSRIVGKIAESALFKKPFIRIFIKRYKVDLSEAIIQDPDAFKNFNAFFTRELKANARPLEDQPGAIICPADGAVSQLGSITQNQLLQAKGRHYNLDDLLGGDEELATLFHEGDFATIYLSPRDYHRVHMPLGGVLQKTVYVPGDLFSVNQTTANAVPNLFARNERLICLFQTEAGPMALILVGAMIVAGIDTVWSGQVCPGKGLRNIQTTDYSGHTPPVTLATGAEMGRFRLGSTAIVLFGHGSIDLEPSLEANSSVSMGQSLGKMATGDPNN